MIYLETERLIIRDSVAEDLETHHALMSSDTVMRYLRDIQTHSLQASQENLAVAMSEIGKPDRRFYFLRIQEKASGALVGQIGYTVTAFMQKGKRADIGYFIHEAFWGRGYTTEALRAVLAYGFTEGGVYRMGCGCLAENRGSERVMQKCGMIKEGTLKEYTEHEGVLKDRVVYRLLRPEWEKIC